MRKIKIVSDNGVRAEYELGIERNMFTMAFKRFKKEFPEEIARFIFISTE